jgi:excisionase family DNA binding protein
MKEGNKLPTELFLSVADASRLLGVTPQTVRLMIRRGTVRVAAKTVGGIQLFRLEEVERVVAERQVRQVSPPSMALARSEAP